MKRRNPSLFALGVLLATACFAGDFALPPNRNVVLLGDSITSDGAYGQIMQDLIDERFSGRGVRILARGANGETARGAHRRIERDVAAWRPAWVVLNFGINDARYGYTPEQFLAHTKSLLDAIQKATGGTRIAIASPFYSDRKSPLPHMEDYVQGLKQLAEETGHLYIPLWEETQGIGDQLPEGINTGTDPLHPNPISHWAIAQSLLRGLNFPFDGRVHEQAIPARRATKARDDTPAGLRFDVDLPEPLRVTLTDPPLGRVAAHRAEHSITIDGKLDDWPERWPIRLGTPEQRIWGVVRWDGPHVTAGVDAVWNDDGWYFAIDVHDSFVRHAAKRPNVVSRDAIEVCLDLRPAADRKAKPHIRITRKTKQVYQYVLAPAGHEVKHAVADPGSGDPGMLDGVQVASQPTKMGYALEFFVPAAHFPGGKPTTGMTIGFDVAVIDVDRQDNYLSATEFRWSGSPWSALWTREFGEMTLTDPTTAGEPVRLPSPENL